jgi:hypothetical protein
VNNHTPLPWKYVPWHVEEGPSAVRAPDGHLVTTTASDEDAAFIVKAVNAHDALVALLRECLSDYGHHNFTDRHGMADRIRRVLAAVGGARD